MSHGDEWTGRPGRKMGLLLLLLGVSAAVLWGLRDGARETEGAASEPQAGAETASAAEPPVSQVVGAEGLLKLSAEDDEPEQTFAVQVDDAGGGPVPGATVKVTRFQPHFVRVTETDDRGHAEVSAPKGHFLLLVSAEGYAGESRGLVSPKDQRFELMPASQIAGQVVNAQGQGVATHVRLCPSCGPHTVSADDGHFVFESVRPGRYRPYVQEAQWFGEAKAIAVTPAASITGLRIMLHAAGAVLVNLRYEDGTPCPDPWINVTHMSRGDGSETSYGSSLDAGERADAIEAGRPTPFSLTVGELRSPGTALAEGLWSGRYKVATRCEADEEGIQREDVEVRAGQLLRLAFRHPRTGRLEGRVVDSQARALETATVKARNSAGQVALTTSIFKRNFGLALPPGRYQVWAEGDYASPAKGPEQTVDVRADGVTQVELTLDLDRIAELVVKVRRPDGKSAGQSISVDVHGPAERGTWTDRKGRAGFKLEPGRYSVTASESEQKVQAQVDLPPEGAEVELVLEDKVPRCSGIVVDAQGNPVADARVVTTFAMGRGGLSHRDRLWLAGGGRATKTNVTTDLAGRFEVPVDHSSSSRLWARAAQGVGQDVCEGTPLTVQLSPASGRLTVRGGDAAAPVHVVQTDGPFVASEQLDARGMLALEKLPVGEYVVVLDHPERTGIAEGKLREGAHLTLELSSGPVEALAGILLGPDGAPLPESWLSMADPIGVALGRREFPGDSDAQGRFSVEPAPRWPVHLYVPGAKHCVPPTRWAPGDGPIELRMVACVQ